MAPIFIHSRWFTVLKICNKHLAVVIISIAVSLRSDYILAQIIGICMTFLSVVQRSAV